LHQRKVKVRDLVGKYTRNKQMIKLLTTLPAHRRVEVGHRP